MFGWLKPKPVPPPLAMLLAAVLMWVLHRFLPLSQLIALPWNYIAIVPVVISRMISVAAGQRFRRVRTTFDHARPEQTSHLVTEGTYRISRNPMYVGLVLMLIAWALWLGTASPWVIPPLFAIFMTITHIAPEERALETVFGENYVAYRHRVRRWIGRY
jgi:protein-S-isoprenylcysteine O-methyltransferase Ste14